MLIEQQKLVGLDLQLHFFFINESEQQVLCRIMKVLSKQELKKAEEALRNHFPRSQEVCKSHLIIISGKLYTGNRHRLIYLKLIYTLFKCN